MNNSYNAPREIEIDLVDLMWKLLMQWKAVLIVCILMALLVPGVKYVKDSKAYKAQLADKKKAEEQTSKPANERIESALKLLPADARDDVLFLIQQQEMIDTQKDYLNNSIWINTDPASQRHLSIKYLLKSGSGTDMRTLADAYSTVLHTSETLEELCDVIDPDSRLEYIDELVDTKNEDIESGKAESAIYTVTVTLPEDTDAEIVTGIIDAALSGHTSQLNDSVGDHSLTKVGADDRNVYNKDVVERRANTTYTINNLNSSIDNAKSKLSPEQQTAFESIVAIKQAAGKADAAADTDDSASDDELQPPGFSKKYSVLGLLLGVFLYAGIYVVMLILKKVVTSASTAQNYTGTRLLGEIYSMKKHKGISALFTSNMVAKWRYKEKLDADKQIDTLASTVDAVCSHHSTDKLTLLLSGIGKDFDSQIKQIVSRCSSAGKKSIDVLNADEMDEKALTSVKNAVYVVSNDSKVDKLGDLISLVRDYDVTPLGTVFLEAL